MTPSLLLWLVLAVTAGAYAGELARRRWSRRPLRRLAAEARMNFGRDDSFRLTPKVARHFPLPGAAHLRLANIIYGLSEGRYRYVFTAEYTAGVVAGKRRLVRAGSFTEPRDRDGDRQPPTVLLAPPELPLIEQYRHLLDAEATSR